MNADPIAKIYRWLEYAAFGRTLERCRYSYLSRIRQARRVFILGEGDGRFLQQLVTCNPGAGVDVVEASAAMIKLASARLPAGAKQQVVFHHQDFRTADLGSQRYDVAVALFSLDCFSEPDAWAVIQKIESLLQPGGLLVVSEFRQPQRGWPALHARCWLWLMYLFFRFASGLRASELPPYQLQLREAGLALLEHRYWAAGMITAQLWQKPLAPLT